MTQIIKTRAEWRKFSHSLKGSIGFVPTMGALHQGHLSLMERSAQSCEHTLVSLFVNPLQFGANEDLDSYPRRLQKDVELCNSVGVKAVFAPAPDEMYAYEHQNIVVNQEVENLYCGAYRPGHFRGVLTVVLKLLMLSNADKAFFGEKDRQQLFMIHRMALDFDLKTEIIGCPIIRELDGLAMSSRNEYLSDYHRSLAPNLYQIMNEVQAKLALGIDWNSLQEWAKNEIVDKGFDSCQYLELASQKSLQKLNTFSEPAYLLAAAYMGTTRLIDNIEINL